MRGPKSGYQTRSRFIAAMAAGILAAEAYAGAVSKDLARAPARSGAAGLLCDPEVRREIRRLRLVYAAGIGVTQQRIVSELAVVAFRAVDDVDRQSGGAWGAKMRALEILARYTQVIRDADTTALSPGDEGKIVVVYQGDWRRTGAPSIAGPSPAPLIETDDGASGS